MPDLTAPHSLLLKAVAVILTNGLVQEDYYEPPTDDRGRVLNHNPKDCPVCPRGAISVAAGQHPEFAADFDAEDDTYEDEHLAAFEAIAAAERLLVDHLVGVVGFPAHPYLVVTRSPAVIEEWADAEGRTLPQIVDAMRAAAERGRTDA